MLTVKLVRVVQNSNVKVQEATRKVDSIEEASAVVTGWQSRHGVGASECGKEHGMVFDKEGQALARIAYNGRSFLAHTEAPETDKLVHNGRFWA